MADLIARKVPWVRKPNKPMAGEGLLGSFNKGLRGFWLLNESGDTLQDISVNKKNLAVDGNLSTIGPDGKQLTFSESSSENATNSSLGGISSGGVITIFARVRYTGSVSTWARILDLGKRRAQLLRPSGTNNIMAWSATGSAVAQTLNLGEYYNVIGEFDFITGYVRLCVNGTCGVKSSLGAEQTGDSLILGVETGPNYPFRGDISLAGVWSRKLTDDEISVLGGVNPFRVLKPRTQYIPTPAPEIGLLPYKVPWVRKPEGPQKVRDKYRGILACGWIFNEGVGGPRCIGNPSEQGTLSGSSWYVGKGGRNIQHTSTSNSTELLSDSGGVLPVGPITILVGYNKVNATLRKIGAFGVVSTTTAHLCGAHIPWDNGTVYWDYGGNTEDATRESVAGLTVEDDDWAFTVGSRGMEIWQNGILRSSNSANPTRSNATGQPFTLGKHGTVSLSDLARYRYLYVFEGQLSESEIRSFSNNPYQLLKPRTQWIPVAAAAGGTTYYQTNTGSTTPTGAVTKNTLKALSGSITPSGIASTVVLFTAALAGSITPSGSLAKKTKKALEGSLTLAGAITKKTAKALSGSLTPVGTLVKKTSRLLSGSTTPSGTLTSVFTAIISLAGSITPSGVVTTIKGLAVGGVAFLRPIYYKIIRKVFRKSVNESKH